MPGERPPYKKRTGRPPGPTKSPHLILDAARAEFSTHGYEGSTVRAIANAAHIDAALIHHFFLSKEGLFLAAVQDSFAVPGLLAAVLDGPPDAAGARLTGAFIAHWDSPEIRPRVQGVLRSVRGVEGATEAIRDFVGTKVLRPVAEALGHGRPELRASLAGSLLVGLAYMRYVLDSEPIASMPGDQLAATVAGSVQRYLTAIL